MPELFSKVKNEKVKKTARKVREPKKEKRQIAFAFCLLKSGGRGGIRTLDTEFPYAAFPGRYIQPLCHPSKMV